MKTVNELINSVFEAEIKTRDWIESLFRRFYNKNITELNEVNYLKAICSYLSSFESEVKSLYDFWEEEENSTSVKDVIKSICYSRIRAVKLMVLEFLKDFELDFVEYYEIKSNIVWLRDAIKKMEASL